MARLVIAARDPTAIRARCNGRRGRPFLRIMPAYDRSRPSSCQSPDQELRASPRDFGSNQDRLARLESQQLTPAVIYANTSASDLGTETDFEGLHGFSRGRSYKATMSLATLMSWADPRKLAAALEPGDRSKGHFVRHPGGAVESAGRTSFTLKGGVADPDQVEIEVANNGALCLHRLARAAGELAQAHDIRDPEHFPEGVALEVHCQMTLGNEVEDPHARDEGFFSENSPVFDDLMVRDSMKHLFAALAAGWGLSMEMSAGDFVGAPWRSRSLPSFDDAAKKLAGELAFWLHREERPTGIHAIPDLSGLLREAKKGGTGFDLKVAMDTAKKLAGLLADAIDPSFLQDMPEDLRARFQERWKAALVARFERHAGVAAATWTNLKTADVPFDQGQLPEVQPRQGQRGNEEGR